MLAFSGSADLNSCNTGWVDTGEVAEDSTRMDFEQNKQYGAWFNPRTFAIEDTWQVSTALLHATILLTYLYSYKH